MRAVAQRNCWYIFRALSADDGCENDSCSFKPASSAAASIGLPINSTAYMSASCSCLFVMRDHIVIDDNIKIGIVATTKRPDTAMLAEAMTGARIITAQAKRNFFSECLIFI